jgi:hypothetical protein
MGASLSGNSHIEILSGFNFNFEYHIVADGILVPIILNEDNGFRAAIDRDSLDTHCILLEPVSNFIINIIDLNNINRSPLAVLKSEDDYTYEQLFLKQTFFKYFLESEEVAPVTYSNTDIMAYLDNSYGNRMSTVVDLVGAGQSNLDIYLLRLPFLSLDYFLNTPATDLFEIVDTYFTVNATKEMINYNTILIQTFHNTIDIPAKFFDFIFAKNDNGYVTTPKLSINLDVFIDSNLLLTSTYTSTDSLKLDMTIKTINFLKKYEGFEIEFFETDLEKYLQESYGALVMNIRVNSPRLFIVNNSATIYNQIEENLDFVDILDFVPPYFYFDYDNLIINLSL